jgi:enamine deaminase RidA (YjgF/YER057c/UK114 family)
MWCAFSSPVEHSRARLNQPRDAKEKRKNTQFPNLLRFSAATTDLGLALPRLCRLAVHDIEIDMHRPLAPTTIHPPFSAYSNGVEIPAGQRLVLCSGQLGIAADGTIPPSTEAQAQLAFDNIAAILAEAGLGLQHVVRLNAYVTGREHLRPYMDARNARFAAAPLPASTLMIVSGFARPEFFVEVEAIAAGPASEV